MTLHLLLKMVMEADLDMGNYNLLNMKRYIKGYTSNPNSYFKFYEIPSTFSEECMLVRRIQLLKLYLYFNLRHKNYPNLSVKINDDDDLQFTSLGGDQSQTIDLDRELVGPGSLSIFLRNQFTLSPGHVFFLLKILMYNLLITMLVKKS